MSASVTFLQAASSTANASEYTFSNQNLGAASADRHIVVAFSARKEGDTPGTITGVTVAGIAASLAKEVWATHSGAINTANVFALYIAAVPTGTSGDVVVTLSVGMARAGLGLYAVNDIGSITPHDTDAENVADPIAMSIDCEAGGVVIGTAGSGDNVTAWTGLTEDFEQIIESALAHSGASAEFAEAQSGLAIEADSGAIAQGGVVASWSAAGGGDPEILGDLTFTLTPAAAMAVDRDLVGSIAHTLTPAAQMAVGRAILGELTFTLTPAADMSQADANAITGDVAFELVPAAAMAVGRALTGDVTHTLNVTAAMAFSEGNAIVGDVAFELVPAAAMAAGRALTGDVTVTLDVAADLAFTPPAYEVAGEVAFTLTPAAAMTFSDAEAIVGDVAFTLTPAATMSAALVHAIAGDVAFVFMSAGGMVYTAPVEISSPLLEQIAADLDGFFDLNAFAVPCRYDGTDFAGIFDAEALDAPGGEIVPASLLAKTADVAEVARGDTVRVAGADYVVTGRLPDGVGLTRLVFSL